MGEPASPRATAAAAEILTSGADALPLADWARSVMRGSLPPAPGSQPLSHLYQEALGGTQDYTGDRQRVALIHRSLCAILASPSDTPQTPSGNVDETRSRAAEYAGPAACLE